MDTWIYEDNGVLYKLSHAHIQGIVKKYALSFSEDQAELELSDMKLIRGDDIIERARAKGWNALASTLRDAILSLHGVNSAIPKSLGN